MASSTEEDARKASAAFALIPGEVKEQACAQTLVELSHIVICQIGKELAANLFMDMAKSSPYVGLTSTSSGFQGSLLETFCNCPGYWLAINTRDYQLAESIYAESGGNIVAYLEYKFDEVREEAAARGEVILEDDEEVEESQDFDSLYEIGEFCDFEEEVWREARTLIDMHEGTSRQTT